MILFILSAGELLRRRLRLYFIDKKILFPLSLERLNIMLTLRSPLPKSKIWTAVAWDVLPKSEIWTRPQRAGGCSIPPKGGGAYANYVSYRTVYRYDYSEAYSYKEQPPLCQVTADAVGNTTN